MKERPKPQFSTSKEETKNNLKNLKKELKDIKKDIKKLSKSEILDFSDKYNIFPGVIRKAIREK